MTQLNFESVEKQIRNTFLEECRILREKIVGEITEEFQTKMQQAAHRFTHELDQLAIKAAISHKDKISLFMQERPFELTPELSIVLRFEQPRPRKPGTK